MKWMKERDLLLAQTAAFVQSVTGKRPSIETLTGAPSKAAPAVEAVSPATVHAAEAEPTTEPETPAVTVQVAQPTLPVPTVIEVPPPSPPPPLTVTVVEVPPAPMQPPPFAKLDLRGDFQSEVRAHVASFRANQQRFLREREEYCTTTMAKVRAAIRDNSELPRSGK